MLNPRTALIGLTALLTLTIRANAADPPDDPPRKPRVVPMVVGGGLLAGAGVGLGLSQVERARWNRQRAEFQQDPLRLPWSDEERARLKASDQTLRRHYLYGQSAGVLGAVGAGLVVVGSFGKRGNGAADQAKNCPILPGASPTHVDRDGCPIVAGSLTILASQEGEPREGLSFTVVGMGFSQVVLSGQDPVVIPDLLPGLYEIRSMDPFWEGGVTVRVKEGLRPVEVPMTEIIPGTLVVTARDDDGQPIRDATATVAPRGGGDGQKVTLDETGYGEALVAPGSWSIFVEAPGFGVRRTNAEVEPEQRTEIATTLKPARAEMSGERIELKEKVFFTAGRDEVDPRSYELLDEVANMLTRRSDIILLEIQGHTSAEGGFELNQRLSERRAAAVEAYLHKQGIPKNRMVAVGYGPVRPLVPEKTEEDRALNRRVELVILHRR